MKTIFTLIIGLMFSFVSFGQQDCNANFTYTIDSTAMTVQFADQSFGAQNAQATGWEWQINGESFTTQNVTYTYTSLPFTACLTASFDGGCSSNHCDSIYVEEAEDPCANYFIEAGYGVVEAGECNGEISVNVSNGTAPYTYNWGSFGTSETISNLCVGNYPVTVTDDNGCSATSTGYIVENDTTNNQIVDSLSNAPIDTCIDFTVISVSVTDVTMNDSSSFQAEWTFVDDQQQTHIFNETYVFQGQYGNYYIEISLNCNGNKAVQSWGNVVTIDNSIMNINTVEKINKISLYPNPVKETATINYSVTENANVTVSIYDYTGKTINVISVNSYKGNNTIKINTNNLKQGVYFAKITLNNTVKTIKFVK